MVSRFLSLTLIAVLLACALSAQVAAPPKSTTPVGYYDVEVEDVLVPTASTAAVSSDVWVSLIVLSNVTSSAVTVTITDNQAARLQTVAALEIDGNSVVVIPFAGGKKFTSGLRWRASTASSIVGYVQGYVRR